MNLSGRPNQYALWPGFSAVARPGDNLLLATREAAGFDFIRPIALGRRLFVQQHGRIQDRLLHLEHVSEAGFQHHQALFHFFLAKLTQDLFEFVRTGLSPTGKVLGEFHATGTRSVYTERIQAAGYTIHPALSRVSQG